jgi:PIN domain nuclease of toxin-antitoxin system
MKLLLDTHVFLCSAVDSKRLSKRLLEALQDTANDVYVSSAAAWEIAIRFNRGKLPLPLSPAVWTSSRIAKLGFKELAISVAHASAVSSLPQHHADPFDRLMVAQAQLEGLTLVTADTAVLRYPVKLLDAR